MLIMCTKDYWKHSIIFQMLIKIFYNVFRIPNNYTLNYYLNYSLLVITFFCCAPHSIKINGDAYITT